jgi:omega-amidase
MTSLIPVAFRPFRLALIQLATCADKQSNLRRARQFVKEACANGANLVVLPVPLSNFNG